MNEKIKRYDNILEETRQEVNDLIYKYELFWCGQEDLAKELLAIDKRIAFFRMGNAVEARGDWTNK